MKDCFLKFLKEKRIYCIIASIAVLMIFAISSIFIIMNKDSNNYSGNLMNNGFAVNLGNWTYYIKQDGIYKVNSNGTKIEKVLESNVFYLNSDGNYLYFVESNDEKYNLVKMKKNGKDKEIIIEDIDEKMITVTDGWIYYSQDDNFYKIKTNGKDRIKLLNKDVVAYQIDGNNIYYAYKDGIDCIIAKIKTNGTEIIELESNCNPNFYVDGNKIYYIKEEYNSEKYEYEYTLCEMKESGEKKEITKLPNTIKQINMSEDGIYYLTTENYEKYELYKMDYSGKNNDKIEDTRLNTKINIIGKDVYYMDLIGGTNTAIYRIDIKNANKQEM